MPDLDIDVFLKITRFLTERHLFNPMKIIRLLTVAFCLCLLPSCSLLGSLLKIPVSVLKTVGRTAGLSRLSDEKAQPIEDEAIENATQKEEAVSEKP